MANQSTEGERKEQRLLWTQPFRVSGRLSVGSLTLLGVSSSSAFCEVAFTTAEGMVLNPVIKKLVDKRVVLASGSPRRQEILTNAVSALTSLNGPVLGWWASKNSLHFQK